MRSARLNLPGIDRLAGSTVPALIFFAHSTSVHNETGVRSGWANPPLSDHGRTQAETLGQLLGAVEFTRVYSSDLLRARQTAALAFPDCERRNHPDLREMHYGELTGMPDAHFPPDQHGCITTRFAGGECCLDVEYRVRRFLTECVGDVPTGLVGHKYTQLALEVICNGASWAEAIDADWRQRGNWQPGWRYNLPVQGV